VPGPWVVAPCRVLLPFLKSSTAPSAMLKVPCSCQPKGERAGLDVDHARVVEGDAEVVVVIVFDCLL
jgi:hypothetical protein